MGYDDDGGARASRIKGMPLELFHALLEENHLETNAVLDQLCLRARLENAQGKHKKCLATCQSMLDRFPSHKRVLKVCVDFYKQAHTYGAHPLHQIKREGDAASTFFANLVAETSRVDTGVLVQGSNNANHILNVAVPPKFADMGVQHVEVSAGAREKSRVQDALRNESKTALIMKPYEQPVQKVERRCVVNHLKSNVASSNTSSIGAAAPASMNTSTTSTSLSAPLSRSMQLIRDEERSRQHEIMMGFFQQKPHLRDMWSAFPEPEFTGKYTAAATADSNKYGSYDPIHHATKRKRREARAPTLTTKTIIAPPSAAELDADDVVFTSQFAALFPALEVLEPIATTEEAVLSAMQTTGSSTSTLGVGKRAHDRLNNRALKWDEDRHGRKLPASAITRRRACEKQQRELREFEALRKKEKQSVTIEHARMADQVADEKRTAARQEVQRRRKMDDDRRRRTAAAVLKQKEAAAATKRRFANENAVVAEIAKRQQKGARLAKRATETKQRNVLKSESFL
jgi:hypothetical protein